MMQRIHSRPKKIHQSCWSSVTTKFSVTRQMALRRCQVSSRYFKGERLFVACCVVFLCLLLMSYAFAAAFLPKPQEYFVEQRAGGGGDGPDQYPNDQQRLRWSAGAVDRNTMEISLPLAQWPVSIHDENEVEDYDSIVHPGNHSTVMKVPKFWSRPVHQNKLMSRSTALSIGSCAEADPVTGSYSRGDQCPLKHRTIHVAIASYRDFECRTTVESIFLRAQFPERIRVGVVDQIVNGIDVACNAPREPCDQNPEQLLCKYASQIDVYQMDAILSIGPVFARHIGYRLYRGEYYVTQSDAHATFVKDWDSGIIEQWESTNNEMAVLSTYLSDVQGSIDENGNSLKVTRPIMCVTDFEGSDPLYLRHGTQPEWFDFTGTPLLHPFWAAGFSFGRGHFVVNVPYDWIAVMIFQGEEINIAVRAFTIGYDFYAPQRSVCFHHYAVRASKDKRRKVPSFWENYKIAEYWKASPKTMRRLMGVVHMLPDVPSEIWDHTEEDIYGIGGVRTPEKFYQTFGIDVKAKKVEKDLCSFVDISGRMHKMFTRYMRSDGMGIDYGRITYRHKSRCVGTYFPFVCGILSSFM